MSTSDPNPDPYPDPARRPGPRRGPLAGVRITDFCWMGVGAVATRLLADFGAQVIRIEDRERLDMPRRLPIYKGGGNRSYGEEDAKPDPNKGGLFNNYNRNKLAITINMRTDQGRELTRELIRRSDCLTENFAPGVMERWGLDEASVRALNPSVIYARMSGFGHSGPHHEYRSYGPVVQAACGLSHISGLPGETPSGWGLSYMDNQAAYMNSAALLAALLARKTSGKGTDVDVSAVEAGVQLIGPLLADVGVNKRTTRGPDFPLGNRLEHPTAAPHGVYPALGDDRWIAIAVFNDAEWERFVRALNNPAWTSDARFASQSSRFANQDALDEHIRTWTFTRDRHEIMHTLQAAGVRAGAVQDAEDVNEHDPQAASRNMFFEMDHPVIGPARFEGMPFVASNFAADNWRSGPLLGEDNHWVMSEVLGLSEPEIDALIDAGVL